MLEFSRATSPVNVELNTNVSDILHSINLSEISLVSIIRADVDINCDKGDGEYP
jgi:hypothetical protein